MKTATGSVAIRCSGAATLPLDKMTPLQNGLKGLTAEAAGKLRKSLITNGFCFPFFVWKSRQRNYYLDGHQRDRVLRQMKAEGVKVPNEFPVAFVEAKTKTEAAKLILLQSSNYGKITGETLGLFASENAVDLHAMAPMLDLPSINLENLIQTIEPGSTDADAVPEAPKTAVAKKGDLWGLGDHRLLCGDSTNPEDVLRVMGGGGKANIVFTDPPYGVSIGAKNRFLNEFQRAGRNLKDIKDDDLKPEELKDKLLVPAFSLVRSVMADDCTVFVTAPQGGDLGLMMLQMMKEAGLPVRHVLIWKKNAPTFSMGRLDYDYQHEPILLTWGKKHAFYGAGQHRTSVWEIPKPRSSEDHPTMKPVELYINAFQNNSKQGDVAYEPFAGSGTAFIAAQQSGRVCRGIEIDPIYCDVIIKRWEEFTGRKAVMLK